jgi:hypothetical protein
MRLGRIVASGQVATNLLLLLLLLLTVSEFSAFANISYVVFLPYPVRRSNDDFNDSLFFVPPLFLSLFRVSFTNLFFPVLLVLYGVAD